MVAVPSPAVATPGSAAALAALLVSAVPAGFVAQPDSVGDTGPSDLAKAARDDGSPNAAVVLHSEGFVQGYQRLWEGPKSAQIIVFLYQFATPAGADRDFQRSKKGLPSTAPPGSTSFTVDGLPADKLAAMTGSAPDGSAAIVMFTTGIFNVQVVCNGTASAGLQARAVQIAQDQYQRL
jgi:hypothetical protein